MPNYWLDVFSGKTWDEFLATDRTVSGFRAHKAKVAETVRPGDYFLCYITGISRFIAVLEVLQPSYIDSKTKIWDDEVFPVRFRVRLVSHVDPAAGVPVLDLRNQLSIFQKLSKPAYWSVFFRSPPTRFPQRDGELILKAIANAAANPVVREYNSRKYRTKNSYTSKVNTVAVPHAGTSAVTADATPASQTSVTHEEIQWLLLKLGSDLGLDLWVARNDRNRAYGGQNFHSIPRLRNSVPRQFDDATNKTIELIDVLWLQGDAIIAAFEVEHTTQIYSGLLRMSDLLAMQPNLKIDLYIVAPDERRDKVIEEVNRPTFAKLRLPTTCHFIPYSSLKREVEQIGHRIRYMSPSFISEIAESCQPKNVS